MKGLLNKLAEGENLTGTEMEQAMRQVMTGKATPAQIGAFMMGLRQKGETVEEITAAARVMRSLAEPVRVASQPLVDTCGTGGDGANIFNVSTAAALVAAACGVRIAKHGNRSVSSSTGSADVLEAAGVNLDLRPEDVAESVEKVGIGFLFAPAHHSAMKFAIGPRRELGMRTLFNVLGPLTNPAGARRQVLGVFDQRWLRPLAEVLQALGSERVMVVHARDGLDEISVAAVTDVVELKDGTLHEYSIDPAAQLGIWYTSLDAARVGSAGESLKMILDAFRGGQGVAADLIAVNAAAVLQVAGLAEDLLQGLSQARTAMGNGQALAKLEALRTFTQGVA